MIGKYERGDAVPFLEVAKKIADALDVSLDYLAGEESAKKLNGRTWNDWPTWSNSEVRKSRCCTI